MKSLRELKVIWILLVVLSLASAIAYFRPQPHLKGLGFTAFWAHKFTAPSLFDIVISGDSRSYRGISPEVIEKFFPQSKVLNFGFSGTPLSNQYINASIKKFSPTANNPILIIGVTPYAFTQRAVTDNGYISTKENVEKWGAPRAGSFQSKLDQWLEYFRAFSYKEVSTLIQTGQAEGYFQDFKENGWIASTFIPLNPRAALPDYRNNFNNNPAKEVLIKEFLNSVSNTKLKGIKVFGFHPPISQPLLELEESMSGFNEASFVADFEKSGGIWLKPDTKNLESYDGSHLTETSAIAFSSELAKEMKKSLLNIQ